MSDFRTIAQMLNLGLLGLGLYSAVESSSEIKLENLTNNDPSIVSKTYIIGASILLAILGFINYFILSSVYDYSKSLNISYKVYTGVTCSVMLVVGAFFLSQFIEINYLKRKDGATFTLDIFPDRIEVVGLVLGSYSIFLSLVMLLHNFTHWGSVKKRVRV
mgnify:CR=1 FL=1